MSADTPIQDARHVMYDGSAYHLLWMGETKYGQRAKLQRDEWTKPFWVDAAKVREVGAAKKPSEWIECAECGWRNCPSLTGGECWGE